MQGNRFGEKRESINRKPQSWRWIVVFAIMGFIFVQSALPADLSSAEGGWITRILSSIFHTDPTALTPVIRKLAHFLEYFLLGMSLLWAIRGGRRGMQRWKGVPDILVAEVIGVLYAISDEIHQVFVPGRSGEVRDVCIDAAGVFAGVLIVGWLTGYRMGKYKNDGM